MWEGFTRRTRNLCTVISRKLRKAKHRSTDGKFVPRLKGKRLAGMKIETLSAIIRLEKEIREQLALEQRRAEERLEEVLQDGKEELAREEARLQQKMAAAVTTARLGDARKRADTIVAEAV